MVARHIGDVSSFLLDRVTLPRYCFEHVVLFVCPTVPGLSWEERVTSPRECTGRSPPGRRSSIGIVESSNRQKRGWRVQAGAP